MTEVWLQLVVSELRATQLVKVGNIRKKKPNPYVVVSFQGIDVESSAVDATVEPVWMSERMTFEIDPKIPNPILNFKVYHKSKKSTPQFRGESSLSLRLEQQVPTQSLPLHNKKGLLTGKIHFKLEYVVPKFSNTPETVPDSLPLRLFSNSPRPASDKELITGFSEQQHSITRNEDAVSSVPSSSYTGFSLSRVESSPRTMDTSLAPSSYRAEETETFGARRFSGASSTRGSLFQGHRSESGYTASSDRLTQISVSGRSEQLGPGIEIGTHDGTRRYLQSSDRRTSFKSSERSDSFSESTLAGSSVVEEGLISQSPSNPAVQNQRGYSLERRFSGITLVQGVTNGNRETLAVPPASPPLRRRSTMSDSRFATLSEEAHVLTGMAEVRSQNKGLLGEAADSLSLLVQFFDKISQLHPIVYATWNSVSLALRIVQMQNEQDDNILHICKEIRDMLVFARNLKSLRQLEGGFDVLAEMLKVIEKAATLIEEYLRVPSRLRSAKNLIWDTMGPRISRCKSELAYWHQLFDRTVSAHIYSTVEDMSSDVANISTHMNRVVEHIVDRGTRDYMKIFGSLPKVHSAMFDRVKQRCSKGTRLELLDDLLEWAVDTSPGTPQVYWLNGQAGMGKSTVAATFAALLEEQKILGGDFFFNRSVAERTSTHGVFVTIAYRLATRIPELKDVIADAVEEEPDIGSLAVSTQWKALIKGPLIKAYSGLSRPAVIVMDAFDECLNPLEILDNIKWDISSLPPTFKIFCTSRPESNLETAFKEMGDHVCNHILSVHDAKSTRDIRIFISEETTLLAKKHGLLDDDPFWPGADRLDMLVARAAGLFIWVRTALEFIGDEEIRDPEEQLQLILEEQVHSSSSPWASLDSLYLQVLRRALSHSAPDFRKELYYRVVGAIVTIRDPLSMTALVDLLDIHARGSNSAVKLVNQTISKIQSLLLATKGDDDPIRMIHKSFADFLTDPDRCTESQLFINPQLQDQFLAIRCLKLMNEKLSSLVFDLNPKLLNDEIDDLRSRFSEDLTSALQYAVTFWAEHLNYASPEPELEELLRQFYFEHFLTWLEVLSILSLVDSGYTSLCKSCDWIEVNCAENTALCDLADDCTRFILEFRDPILQSVPHVRYSALTLAPRDLPVYKTYSTQLKSNTLQYLYGQPLIWPGWKAVLDGHTDSVYSVAFSPDNKLLVSGSEDSTVRLWDASSWTAFGDDFQGHSGIVLAVIFEPDCKHIISGAQDGTLRRWNIATGDPVGKPFRGHTDWVTSLALAAEGGVMNVLISGSMDGTIRTWNHLTGTGNVLCQMGAGVNCVSLSPKGKYLVSGLKDSTLQRWNARTGQALGGLMIGHDGIVRQCSYSPDGRSIVSCSDDQTLMLWDAGTGERKYVCKGHEGPIYGVAFSPDGRYIASGSLDATVRLWDGLNYSSIGVFTQTDCVLSICFSADSQTFIAGNYDFTIRVWNTRQTSLLGEDSTRALKGTVLSANFSSDGTKVVAGLTSGWIEVFDVKTLRNLVSIRKGHQGPIYSATFSPDDKLILTSSHDTTVRQWDATTGQEVRVAMKGHAKRIFHAVYSADSRRVVSSSEDFSVRIWDAVSGSQMRIFSLAHPVPIYAVGYSPDGKHVASGCQAGVLCVWDVESGVKIKEIYKESGSITNIEYSKDGKTLLATSIDGKAIYWNKETDSREERPELFSRSIKYSLESGWMEDLKGRRLCWFPSENRADFRPGIYENRLFVTPNCSQHEFVTIVDLGRLMDFDS